MRYTVEVDLDHWDEDLAGSFVAACGGYSFNQEDARVFTVDELGEFFAELGGHTIARAAVLTDLTARRVVSTT